MRFFDSCCERVTLADIAEDIVNDLRFEEYLKKLYEDRLAVCKECNYLNEGMCGACGCFVELRAVIRNNVCPYEKW